MLSEVVDLARSIARSDAMAGVVDAELSPSGTAFAADGSEARSEEMLRFLCAHTTLSGRYLVQQQPRALRRNAADTLYHPVGTCKMGPETDGGAVVDPSLNVRGVQGLSVADASIIPSIVGANTNAAAAMCAPKPLSVAAPCLISAGIRVGEKAADLLLADA